MLFLYKKSTLISHSCTYVLYLQREERRLRTYTDWIWMFEGNLKKSEAKKDKEVMFLGNTFNNICIC